MPYSLLRSLSEAQLPVAVTADEDLEKLQFLRDAGYIRVSFTAEAESHQPPTATVTKVTALGRMALRHPR
jgi:hypothetical protein